MKNKIIAMTILTCLAAPQSYAGFGDFIKEVGNLPGKVIKEADRTVNNVVKEGERAVKNIKEETIEIVTNTDRGEEERKVRQAYAETARELNAQRKHTQNEFEAALMALSDSIAKIEYVGINPRKVRSKDGKFIDLINERSELLVKRDNALSVIDETLAQLPHKEQAAIGEIRDTYR